MPRFQFIRLVSRGFTHLGSLTEVLYLTSARSVASARTVLVSIHWSDNPLCGTDRSFFDVTQNIRSTHRALRRLRRGGGGRGPYWGGRPRGFQR